MDASSAVTGINVGDTLSLLQRASEFCNSSANVLVNDVFIGTRCGLRENRARGGGRRLKKAIRNLQSWELRKFEEMRRMQNIAISRDSKTNADRIREVEYSVLQQATASSSGMTTPAILSIQTQVLQLEGIKPLLLSSMEEATLNNKRDTAAFRGNKKGDVLPTLLRTTANTNKAATSNLKSSSLFKFKSKSISSLSSLFRHSKKSLVELGSRKSYRVFDNTGSNYIWDETLTSAPTSTMTSTMEKPRHQMDGSSVGLLQLQMKRSPRDSSTASSSLKPKLEFGNTGRNKSFGSLALNIPRVAAIEEVLKGGDSNNSKLMTKRSFSSFNSFHKKKGGKISPILASASPEPNAAWNL